MTFFDSLVFQCSGTRETDFTGHSVWTHDAHVVMDKVSHLNLIAMSLLQTCSYVTEQMRTEVTIDVNKFLEAFSIEVEGGRIHPPSWNRHENNSVTITQSSPIPPTPYIFSMDDYRKCRQEEALRWINLQERRSSIIAQLQPVTPDEYNQLRNTVKMETGPLRRKAKKQAGRKNYLYQVGLY